MEGLQVLEMCLKSGCVCVCSVGPMISLWVGRWRSKVPRSIHPSEWKVNSPNFRFTEFSEVISRILHRSPSQGREERF
jgi:hypothetical protein